MSERLRVVASVLVLLRQGISDLYLAAPIADGTRDQGLEFREMISFRRLDPQLGAIQIGLVVGWSLGDHKVVVRLGSLKVTAKATYCGPVVVIAGAIGGLPYRAVQGVQCSALIIRQTEKRPNRIQDGGVVR